MLALFFEQFKDIFTSISISASYDDLKTLSNASSSLKKQSGQFSEIAAEYGIAYDQRDRLLCLLLEQSQSFFKHSHLRGQTFYRKYFYVK